MSKAATQSMGRSSKRVRDKMHFPFSFKAGQSIGLFELCFNKRSQFIFRQKESEDNSSSTKPMECFFIRKLSWKQVVAQSMSEISEDFKNRILLNYLDKFYVPMKEY
mmetsp:Transcript_13485/g.21062  ORF Transcript_13485/g.21062 Transcript_13485/m.21062 type:complete len:107 (-) Transcript_13485:25-345(-)